MDQDQSSSLFGMEMDSSIQNNLLSISKWTKFISITGICIAVLVLIAMLFGGQQILSAMASLTSLGQNNLAGALIVAAIIILAFVGTWVYFLLRASTMISRGLQSRNTNDLAEGFKAMRIYFVLSVIISTLSILGTLLSFLNT
jgi:hypothetical protein